METAAALKEKFWYGCFFFFPLSQLLTRFTQIVHFPLFSMFILFIYLFFWGGNSAHQNRLPLGIYATIYDQH